MFDQNSSQFDMSTCSICCQLKVMILTERDKLRPQEICYDCWHQHIQNVVLRISYKVGDSVLSPFHNQAPIDIIQCLNSLHPEHYAEIQENLFRKYSSFTKDIEKCPAELCDYVYVGGEKCQWRSKNNIYVCPKCDTSLTVNQNALKNLTAAFYFLFSSRCPKCEIPIEKISGCPHMSCPCGHHFCWYCYKDHPSGGYIDRVYSIHTIPECSFIFLSKIFLFFAGISSILIASSGGQTINYISGLVSTIFSILIRGIFIDGLILLEVMIVMMMKKNKNIFRFHSGSNNKKFIMGIIVVNILIIGALELLDELTFCLGILLGEITLTIVCFGIGYAIVFSIETWFEFVG